MWRGLPSLLRRWLSPATARHQGNCEEHQQPMWRASPGQDVAEPFACTVPPSEGVKSLQNRKVLCRTNTKVLTHLRSNRYRTLWNLTCTSSPDRRLRTSPFPGDSEFAARWPGKKVRANSGKEEKVAHLERLRPPSPVLPSRRMRPDGMSSSSLSAIRPRVQPPANRQGRKSNE